MKKPLNISTGFYGLWFSSKEIKFLNDWYHYCIDVLNGVDEAETVKQKIFVKLFNDKIKPFKEPITYHSKVYQELNLHQKTIIRYYYIETHKEKIISYHNLQGSDSIYYFSKAQLLFAEKVKLPNYLKNAEHYKGVLKKHHKL